MQHLSDLLKKDLSFGKDPEEVHFMFVLTANNFRPNVRWFGRKAVQLDEKKVEVRQFEEILAASGDAGNF